MNSILLEQFFINSSFFFIFVTTLFFFFNFNFNVFKKKYEINSLLLLSCFITIFFHLIIRTIITNHFPLSNLYESLLFLTFILLSFSLFYEFRRQNNFITIILLPIILFINTFATFTLSGNMQQPSALVPALQSNWLFMHVTIMILSYAVLLIGSVFSIVFLVLNEFFTNEVKFINNGLLKKFNFSNSNGSSILLELDNLSYRLLSFGFPLLTIGILSGSVWANETWGSFWNWDPKETWALITWVVYAIYLHSRIIKGLNGKKPAIIASFGFVILWVCYLGVNIFAKGLHSYGWFYST